jgi:hypothetical protein
MRHVLEHEVGGKEVVGVWDDELGKGRIIWVNGKAYDLVRPRDDRYIDRIIADGESTEGVAEANPLPAAQAVGDVQLSLFG